MRILTTAVWDDDFGKASGRDEGTGLAHFLLNPVNDTVDTACSAAGTMPLRMQSTVLEPITFFGGSRLIFGS